MKRKITSKYLQCKEAYLDGFRDGFRIALGIDKAFNKKGDKE